MGWEKGVMGGCCRAGWWGIRVGRGVWVVGRQEVGRWMVGREDCCLTIRKPLE